MLVTAIKKGVYGNILRKPGDTFMIPDTMKKSSWFVPVEQYVKPTPKEPNARQTFSELGNQLPIVPSKAPEPTKRSFNKSVI